MWQDLVCSMHFKKLLRYFIAVILFISACKPELEGPKYTSGNADFSRYVAIGGDYTAGYVDQALTIQGQNESFPALLSSLFSLVEGEEFYQPLVNPGNGFGYNFVTAEPNGKWSLLNYTDCGSQPAFKISIAAINSNDYNWIGNKGPYNNLGVPGAKSYNLYSQIFGKGGTIGNPFFHRFASDTGGTSGLSSTVLGDASLLNPTFFTLWIGINDVLLNAMAGGEANGNSNLEITSTSSFEASIDTIATSLVSNGAFGVIANIPDVTTFPFFNAIPYNGLLLDSAEATALNATSPPGVFFKAGYNAYVVKDPGTSTIRQLKKGELLLLSISPDSVRCFGKGTPQNPIASRYVLDSAEVSKIKSATIAFNNKLKSAATVKNLAFADMYSFFNRLSTAYEFNGVGYSNAYLKNSFFSIDGINPCSKGYAIIANEFIQVINARYNSNLPQVDANHYSGISFP